MVAGFVLVCIGGPCAPLHAQSSSVAGTVALSSQLVDRGQAITPTVPVLQANLRWASPTGWSLGVAGGAELRSPQRLAVALAQVARAWPVSDRWQIQTSLLYYDVPRRGAAQPYRRAEANLTWIYRDVLTLNLSAFRPLGEGSARTNLAAEANLHWPLARHLSLAAGAGVARFQRGYYGYGRYAQARSSYYAYGQAGLVWSDGRWRVELNRIASADAPRPRRGTGGLAPWLATVSWSF